MKIPISNSSNIREKVQLSSTFIKKNITHEDTPLSSVDELAEFYDPYSDLNLFLVQKITQEMRHCGNSKKWSLKIQEALLKKISPEFRTKFPHYRLGIAALKKTWEKIAYYSQQIQDQKEAITQDGKLNIHFFIKENLKTLPALKNHGPLHPSHFAHQLGMKMSECIATIDGTRPKLDHLTKLIWSIQRHLLSGKNGEHVTSPYDEYDKIDRIIVRSILEITVKDPEVSHNELEYKVKEALHALQELPSFGSEDSMVANVSALLAEKMYASSEFHELFASEQKRALIYFVKRHSSLCKPGVGILQLSDLVRRITALYTLASGLPKTLSDQEILDAVQASYPISLVDRPELPQSLYAFISAELVLMRNDAFCRSPSFVFDALLAAYKEAILLPELRIEKRDILEIVIWKTLSETEGLLDTLPYKNGLRIEDEIASILIEHPQKSFSSLVNATVQHFKRTKELIDIKNCDDIERKIHAWVVQGDMLYRSIQIEEDCPLLQLICEEWGHTRLSHTHFVGHICQLYVKQYKEMAMYSTHLNARVWILYKYAWYNLFAHNQDSSYGRFLKWHASSLSHTSLSKQQMMECLHDVVKKMLPLVPFDPKHCEEILYLECSMA